MGGGGEGAVAAASKRRGKLIAYLKRGVYHIPDIALKLAKHCLYLK